MEQEHIVDEKRLLPAIRMQYSKSEQIRFIRVASNGFIHLHTLTLAKKLPICFVNNFLKN